MQSNAPPRQPVAHYFARQCVSSLLSHPKLLMINLLLLTLLLAAGPALTQTPPPPAAHSYYIKGQLGHYNAPAKVYLVGSQGTDSATLHNGRFELRGSCAVPTSAELVLERQGRLRDGWQKQLYGGKMETIWVKSPDRLELFLEPGPVTISSSDSARAARLSGGPLTADYQRLLASTKPFVTKLLAGIKSKEESAAVFIGYQQAFLTFAKANPNSWVGFFALQQGSMMGPPNYAEVAPLYAALSPALRGSAPGREYGAMLDKLKTTTVGAIAPSFTQQTPEGKTVSLADYQGKYVLVDFWASWCGPCRAENPNVLAAYNAFKGKNLEILGVSIDSNRDKWLKAVAEDKLPWTQVSDLKQENEAAQRYSVNSIPQNFLIDPAGRIIATNLRGPELAATLARLLK